MSELEEGFAKLRREHSALELEWADTLDKIKRMMGRVAKRAEVVERAEQEEETVDINRPVGLTSRQAQINAQILHRRSRSA